MISAFYPPESFGGDAIFLERLSRALLSRGHPVDVIHCADSYKAPSAAAVPPAQPIEGLTVHRLQSGFGTLGACPSIIAAGIV